MPFHRIRSLLRNLFRTHRVERELDTELHGYLDLLTAEKVARGEDPEEARRAARLELGGVEQVKEEVRAVRAGAWVEQMLQDLRYAARGLRRAPVFAATAIVTIALGIGANTAVFSVVDSLLLRPLAVDDPDRLVAFYRGTEGSEAAFSYPEIERFAEAAGGASAPLRGVASWSASANWMRAATELERVIVHIVSPNYFEVVGARPALGLTFGGRQEADTRGMVVISHRLWRDRFGADPSVLGRSVRLGPVAVTIVGVSPPTFTGLQASTPTDIWMTFATLADIEPGWNFKDPREIWLSAIGRLAPGVSVASAEAVLRALPAPSSSPAAAVRLISAETPVFDPDTRESAGRLASLIAAVAGLVLLIACANVANLLVVRAAARRAELGVRLAVGASRGRIVRQLVVESFLLCAIGCAAGLVLANWTLQLVVSLAPPSAIPPGVTVAIDARMVLFACVLALCTAALFSILPAWQASRADLAHVIRLAPAARPGAPLALRRVLVVTQVALSAVLMAGAGLFVRTLIATVSIQPGYDVDRVLLTSIDFSVAKMEQPVARAAADQLRERVAALPGVESVAFGQIVPFTGASIARPAFPEGERVDSARETEFLVSYGVVSDGYFRTLGLPLRGRDFATTDTEAAPKVAVVNETLARRYWPGQDAVGKRLMVPIAKGTAAAHEVIGVVPDGKYVSLTEQQQAYLYLPLSQNYRPRVTVHVRAGEHAATLAPVVRTTIAGLHPDLPAYNLRTMRALVDRSVAQPRLVARFLLLFGGIALVVAAVGVYGLTAYTVMGRTKEVGVRIALGARPRDVVRMLMTQSTLLVALGLSAGTVAALALTRFVRTMLFGVSAWDPVTFVGMVVVLSVCMLAATAIPARRAARIDPVAALRVD